VAVDGSTASSVPNPNPNPFAFSFVEIEAMPG
jgi:hypothetical protein